MTVEYFTYKVEFQERGAGHIHGTLWLKLERIEGLIRKDYDQFLLSDEVVRQEKDTPEDEFMKDRLEKRSQEWYWQ